MAHNPSTTMPNGYSQETLEKNLAALARRQPEMVQRICWPVNSSHVIFGEGGEARYRLHGSAFPLNLSEALVPSVSAHVKESEEILAFGTGLGETVDDLLRRFPGKKITAWEKDPWLLRLFLMQGDFRAPLESGSLTLSLGIDLIHRVPVKASCAVVHHPLLKEVYHNEAGLLNAGIGEKRVIVNTGGLFVEDAASAFKGLGYSVYQLDLGNVSLEEIEYSAIQFKPGVLFSINYLNGLSELARKLGVTLVCWEIDHSVDTLSPLRERDEKSLIFTYREKNVGEFRRAGFARVEFLPMAANPDLRKPVTLSGMELETYSAPISFVGNLLAAQALGYRKALCDLYREYLAKEGVPAGGEEDPFEEMLLKQNADFTRYLLPEIFQARLPGFGEYFRQRTGTTIAPVKLLAETGAAEKRLRYVARLARIGVKVWGDEGWKSIEREGMQYMGPAGHKNELNKIYCGSSINLEISRLYQMDVVNMRIFDILACGGFLLAEHSEDLVRLFEPGREIATYRTPDEMEEKARYYLAHREEAEEIARNGMEAVRIRHTVQDRVKRMLESVG